MQFNCEFARGMKEISRGTPIPPSTRHPSLFKNSLVPGGDKKTSEKSARAKERIVEYRNSCAIRGLPSALPPRCLNRCRVLPFLLNIEFRSPAVLSTRVAHPAPSPGCDSSRERRLSSGVSDANGS